MYILGFMNLNFRMYVQFNLDLVTSNLVTNCDLVLFCKTFFSMYYIKSFDLVTSCNLVTVFAETKSVTKLRLHCMYLEMGIQIKTVSFGLLI
jgi:hypothetical protein